MLLRISTKMTSVAIALLGICYRTSAAPAPDCGCTGIRPKISNGELKDRIDDYIKGTFPADLLGEFKDVPIGCWDTSSVEDFSFAFANQHNFNEKLCWDVSSATTMRSMFYAAFAFNQPLQDWNTSSVTDMYSMFADAIAFNQPLDNWELSSVKNMVGMFYYAKAFDQCLSTWPCKVQSGTIKNYLFTGSSCTIQDRIGDASCQSGDACILPTACPTPSPTSSPTSSPSTTPSMSPSVSPSLVPSGQSKVAKNKWRCDRIANGASPDLFKKSCKTSKSTKAPSSTGKKDKKGKGKGSK